MIYLPIGTVLFSINLNPKENSTPGFYNHCALIADNYYNIVEAQSGQGVILTKWQDYRKRPYDWVNWAVLFPRSRNNGLEAAQKAKSFVGRPYGKFSSIRINGRRMNCVKVVGEAYGIKVWIPDDFSNYKNLFTNKISEVTN